MGVLYDKKGEPKKALEYYALKKKLCTREQIVKGLPSFVLHMASILAEREGINFGR